MSLETEIVHDSMAMVHNISSASFSRARNLRALALCIFSGCFSTSGCINQQGVAKTVQSSEVKPQPIAQVGETEQERAFNLGLTYRRYLESNNIERANQAEALIESRLELAKKNVIQALEEKDYDTLGQELRIALLLTNTAYSENPELCDNHLMNVVNPVFSKINEVADKAVELILADNNIEAGLALKDAQAILDSSSNLPNTIIMQVENVYVLYYAHSGDFKKARQYLLSIIEQENSLIAGSRDPEMEALLRKQRSISKSSLKILNDKILEDFGRWSGSKRNSPAELDELVEQGTMYRRLGMREEALQVLDNAHKVALFLIRKMPSNEATSPESHPLLISAVQSYLAALDESREYQFIRSTIRLTEVVLETKVSPDSLVFCLYQVEFAAALLGLGQIEEANARIDKVKRYCAKPTEYFAGDFDTKLQNRLAELEMAANQAR